MDYSRSAYGAVPLEPKEAYFTYDVHPMEVGSSYDSPPLESKANTAYDTQVLIQNSSPTDEQPKVALDKGFKPLRYIIHILTICVTAAIVQMSFRYVYVSDEDNWEDKKWTMGLDQEEIANILQLPAKIHEILIMGSVGTILFSVIRSRLVGKPGIPFGFLTGGYQVGSVEYIFSEAYWGPLKGAFKSRKLGLVGLGLVIFLTMLYSMVVGPASAMLLVPRIRWWKIWNPFNGVPLTTFESNAPQDIWLMKLGDDLYDLVVNDLKGEFCDTGNFTTLCPAGGSEMISEWAYARANQGAQPNVTMTSRFGRATRDVTSVTSAEVPTVQVATSLFANVAELAGVFWNYVHDHDVGTASGALRPKFTLTKESHVLSPLVRTECKNYDWADAQASPDTVIFPQSLQADPSQSIPVPWDHLAFPSDGGDGIGSGWLDVSSIIANGQRNTSLLSTGVSLAATLLTAYNRTSDEGIVTQSNLLNVCLIDARWAGTEVSFEPGQTDQVSHNLTQLSASKDIAQLQLNEEENKAKYNLSDSIVISGSWADLMAPPGKWAIDKYGTVWSVDVLQSYLLPFTDKDRGSVLVTTTNDDGSTSQSVEEDTLYRVFKPAQLGNNLDEYKSNVTQTLSIIISLAVTDGLARSTYPFSNYGVIVDADDTSIGAYDLLHQQGDVEQKATFTLGEMSFDNHTFWTFGVERYGYGYGMDSKTVQFAVSVVLIQVLIVLIYLVLDLWFWFRYRWTSTAWEGIGDIVALAWRSTPPDAMENTGAGISQMDTWNSRVRIREKRGAIGSQVELVVKGEKSDRGNRTASMASGVDLTDVESWGVAASTDGVLKRGTKYT